VLGKASEFDSNPPELKDANSLMVLETAAIERFSLPIYQLLNKSHGLAVSDFDKAISTIWTRLLLNFVQLNSCRPVKTRHVWQTTGPCISASVKQFADRTTCQNATTALRKLHPHLWPQ
jgi:hypothetical protein